MGGDMWDNRARSHRRRYSVTEWVLVAIAVAGAAFCVLVVHWTTP